jgi:mono/diheme cytochrome c family protein
MSARAVLSAAPLAPAHRRRVAAITLAFVGLLPACRQDMHDQPRFEPFEKSDFFPDHRSARPRVPGTVARDESRDVGFADTGRVDGKLADAFPEPITTERLARGQRLFDIHCAPCHGRDGGGEGVVVRRGMRPPASFHSERVRAEPAAFYFDVMTRGFGAMFDVADRVPRDDRWAIAAYVRALQRSQTAKLADVPPEERARLEAQK